MTKTLLSLEAEIVAAESRLASDRFAMVETLRALHEAAARLQLVLPEATGRIAVLVRAAVGRGITIDAARGAELHLACAEQFQWQIGTWATAGGEGLASMSEVRELQLARAWLLTVLPDADARDRARALLAEVDGDANDIAAGLAPERNALRTLLAR